MKNAVIYLPGTDDSALADLETLIQRRGWVMAGVFADPHDAKRPSWSSILRLARRTRRRPFDAIVTTRAGEIFRSTRELVLVLSELRQLDVELVTACEPLPLDVFALGDFERTKHSESTRAGIAAARRLGSRPGRPPRSFDIVRARELRRAGWSYREVAVELGVPIAVLHRQLVGADPVPKTLAATTLASGQDHDPEPTIH